jgi:hypothetical protein
MSRADKWLFLRAVGWLAVARAWLVFVPFRKLADRLGGSHPPTKPDTALLDRVSFAVNAASANVQWSSDCFPKAIAASNLLQSFGYGSSIHLGIERSGETELLGHAWLTCGSTVVTGGEERNRYVEIHRLGE